ncbi:MAG: HAD-IC family P-type ATPase [Roseiflexaceae bacterium]
MSANQLHAQIRAHPGVVASRYDEVTQTVTPRYDGTQTNMAAIEALVRRGGATLRVQGTPDSALSDEDHKLSGLPWMVRLTVTCLVTLILGWVLEDLTALPRAVIWTLYVIAYVSGGFYSVQDAWATLRARRFDVNVLMIVAALGAAAVGQPREGAVLMFLFSLSNTLETYAMGRTHASIRALLDMTPKEAEIYRDDQIVRIPVEELRINDLVLVRPGAQVPADGQVITGDSAVDEASITGESMPVEKAAGARVFAGTLNGQGALDVRVTTAVENSTLARIVAVVREARAQKAQSQDFTDRVIGQYYAYAVLGITLLAIVIPLVFLGWDLRTTFYRAMTLMVVASPCAVVISIPAALLSALANAARGGVLFKGGRHLESAAKVRVVAFDKTGTLTSGRPSVVAIIPIGLPNERPTTNDESMAAPFALRPSSFVPADDALGELTESQVRLLAAAAGIERLSEHPLAQAVVRGATERSIAPLEASDFTALTGMGAQVILGGQRMRIGRPSLWPDLSLAIAALVLAQEQHGRTVVVLGDEQNVWGLIAIADTVRPEAAAAVVRLKQIGITRVVLLTGDNRHAAAAIGAALGVDEVRAELLPDQKVAAIKDLQARYGPVAMVGDGVNDAPALATAALGVAMGADGTAVALESADVLLMADDLSRLPGALDLAKRARRIVRQNLIFAFSVMATLMVLAIIGNIPLPLGVVGHEGSTLLVVANGLRLLVSRRT